MTSCDNSSTCPQEIHLGDIGTIFRITINDCTSGTSVPLDISSATTQELIFKSPSGTKTTKTTTFTTDGTDGQIQYTTITGDLDETGDWKIQARIILPTGTWRSDVVTFRVYENL